jgi:hypothetical protein
LTHQLRSWFLRGALEAVERQHGAAALALIAERVPRRLLPHASLERLRVAAAFDTIGLDDGEELLLFIDSVVGDGSGRVLEGVGNDLASRALNQGAVAKLGDLYGTVARLQAFLDHPFVDSPTIFELKRTDQGFTLSVGVVGRPRATRVLRHLAVGAVAAAARAARESEATLKLAAALMADRAVLTAHYLRSELPPQRESAPPPRSVRRPTLSSRPPSLSAEVERILTSHKSALSPASTATPLPVTPERSSAVQRVSKPVAKVDEPPERKSRKR